jgi:hypothetical protein
MAKKKVDKVTARQRKTVEVPVHYVKSPAFRTIHADGVMGGLMPSGRAMNLAFYSERIPFPAEETFDVGAEGHFISPRERKGKRGIYREIEASIVLDWDTLRSLQNWLEKLEPVLRIASGKGTRPSSGGEK